MEHDTPMETIWTGKGRNASLALVPSLALGHQVLKEDRQTRIMGAHWVRLWQGLGCFDNRGISRTVTAVHARGLTLQSILSSPNKKTICFLFSIP